jgi:hypothetical protein
VRAKFFIFEIVPDNDQSVAPILSGELREAGG